MHSVLAQDELSGDLLVAQAARDQRQHLTFSSREQYRRSVSGRAGHSFGRENGTQCARHRIRIAGPWKVGVPGERDQLRRRYPRRELAAEPIGNRAVVTAVYNQRGRTYLAQLRLNVVAIDEFQQHRRSLGARGVALVTRESLLFDTVGIAQKDVGQ